MSITNEKSTKSKKRKAISAAKDKEQKKKKNIDPRKDKGKKKEGKEEKEGEEKEKKGITINDSALPYTAVAEEEKKKNTIKEIVPDITDDDDPDPFEFEDKFEKMTLTKDILCDQREKCILYHVCDKVSQTWRTGSKETVSQRPDSFIITATRKDS